MSGANAIGRSRNDVLAAKAIMKMRHDRKTVHASALLVSAVGLLWAGKAGHADVTGTYALNTPGQIGSLQLDQYGASVSGSLQLITASTSSPGYTISNSNISGSVHGSKLIIRYIGFLSSSQMFTGERHGSTLTINFPQSDGHLTIAKFRPTTPSAWNGLVTGFETKMAECYELRSLYADYQATRSNYDRYGQSLQTDVSGFQTAVASFRANHVREAKEEQAVDKAAGLNEQAKTAKDALSDNSTDEEQRQAEADLEATDTALSKAESNLWQATDDVWHDLATILRQRDTISTDEANITSLVQHGRDDAAKIAALEAALKVRNSEPSKSAHADEDLALKKVFEQINAQVSALMPKPQPPINGQGTVVSAYAAVRRYQVDDGSLHSDVKVLLAVMKGQTIHHIKAQTFNDYVVELSDGTPGMISKADVEIKPASRD